LLLLCIGVTVFALLQQRVWDALQSTLVAYDNATQTIDAATLIATSDPDGDGLPNYIEATLSTFSDTFDTDGDGLSDGEEFRAWGTDPRKRDTDGDSLSDGDEVNLGTDPNNPDTDGDGIPDNVDVQPIIPPTATITPFPTLEGSAGDVCPGSPTPSQMAVGSQGLVSAGGLPNRIRAEPTIEGEVVGTMPPESTFQVVDGPVCDEDQQLRWWKVDFNGLQGWTVEGEGDERYLEAPGGDEEGEDGGGGGDVEDSGDEDSLATDEVASSLPEANSVDLDFANVGVQMFSQIDSTGWENVLASAEPLGPGWVKIQANWRYLQPEEASMDTDDMQNFLSHVRAAKEQGHQVLISVAKAPDWARGTTDEDGPPDDPQDLASFMSQLLDEVGTEIDAIEIWNEPNLISEWTGELSFDGEGYMSLFTPSYEAIREFSDDMIVVTAGLSPTTTTDGSVDDREFLRQMYQQGLADLENVAVGIHPYGWGNAPDLICCDTDEELGWDEAPQFFFLDTVVDYRNIMLRFADDDALMWVTEFGWSSWDDLLADPPEPWMNYITPEDQAGYIHRALEIGQSLDYVEIMIVWNFNFANNTLITNRDGIVGFSLTLTEDDSSIRPRPVYEALLQLLS
jgi:hypothetical protein